MANQILTNYCNADCGFCFAADSRSRSLREGRRQMEAEEVRSWLDFTLRAGIRELRLLGGEPTLHPQFADFVKMGREAGCTIMVFSNGVMPDAARDALAALDPEVCSVVLNWTAAVKEQDKARRQETMRLLGPRVTLGMTLTSADFSLWEPVSLIRTFGLRRTLRIGLSNPTWKGANRALHPKQYPAVGQALLEASFFTARHEVEMDADCGFVRCMFGGNFDQLKANGFRYISNCTPVLDLCSGGMILPCFGLSNLMSLRREDFADAGEAYARFSEKLIPLHRFGIYPECTECPYFETETCCGGCLAARLRRINPCEM